MLESSNTLDTTRVYCVRYLASRSKQAYWCAPRITNSDKAKDVTMSNQQETNEYIIILVGSSETLRETSRRKLAMNIKSKVSYFCLISSSALASGALPGAPGSRRLC